MEISDKLAEENARVNPILASMSVLALDFDSAREAGFIFAAKRKERRTMDHDGAMITGMANIKGDSVRTRNTKRFSGIDGVHIVTC